MNEFPYRVSHDEKSRRRKKLDYFQVLLSSNDMSLVHKERTKSYCENQELEDPTSSSTELMDPHRIFWTAVSQSRCGRQAPVKLGGNLHQRLFGYLRVLFLPSHQHNFSFSYKRQRMNSNKTVCSRRAIGLM